MTGVQVAGTASGGVAALIVAVAALLHPRHPRPRHADKIVIPVFADAPVPPRYGEEDTGSWLDAARSRTRVLYDELRPERLDAAADTVPPHPRAPLGPGLQADVPLAAPLAQVAEEPPLAPLPPLPRRRHVPRHAAPAQAQPQPGAPPEPEPGPAPGADRAELAAFVRATMAGSAPGDGLVDLVVLTEEQLGGAASVDAYLDQLFGGSSSG